MNTDKTIVLFFYFACMDEKIIKSLAKKTLALLKKDQEQKDIMSRVVFYCHKVWKSKKRNEKYLVLSTNPYINMDKSVPLTSWFDFLKENDPDIITPIIFHKMLNVSDEDIMKGLNISSGTFRYRLSKGLEKLGEILNPMD